MDRLAMPAAMPAEVAERLSDVPEAPVDLPDFADEEAYADIVHSRLHSALAQLFSTRDQVLAAKGIGGLNSERSVEWLLKDLAHLERVLYGLWSDA